MSQADPIAALERAVHRIAQANDAQAALNDTLAYLVEAVGADMGAVFEPAGTSLRFTAGHGLPKKFLNKPPLLARADWDGGLIVRRPGGEPVDQALEEAGRLAGMQTWATLPIAYREHFFGLLLVASRDLLGFTDQAVEQFSIVSRVLGLSLYALGQAGPPPEQVPERTLVR